MFDISTAVRRDDPRLRKRLDAALEKHHAEIRAVLPRYGVRWLPMNDPKGEKTGTDDRLHTSETQFRILVQGVADYAVYMLDPSGHVSSWNSGAERIKGYQPDDIIGGHFSSF